MGFAAALLSQWEASFGRNAPTFTNSITMVTILQLFFGTFSLDIRRYPWTICIICEEKELCESYDRKVQKNTQSRGGLCVGGYTVSRPVPMSRHTVRNNVKMEAMLLQTTIWVASISSQPICPAMTALETAAGVPKRAMRAG